MADLKGKVYRAKEREYKPPFFYREELPEIMEQREKINEQVAKMSLPQNFFQALLPTVWRG
jgi:hypothetical protein